MKINDREIIIVNFSTEKNWIADLPNFNWLCILVDNDSSKELLNEVISKIINNDVCYVCAVGQTSEKTHDRIDEEIVFREVDIEKLHLPTHQIITTWDLDFEEGIWSAIFASDHGEVVIDKIVLLDMTDGKEHSKINDLLTKFKLES